MCAVSNLYGYSYKWLTCLVVTTGVYTFLHWFLAVPLLHYHFLECCNEKWPKDWVAWFLAAAFGVWFVVSVLIVVLWCCLRLCLQRHANESDLPMTTPQKKPLNLDVEKETVKKSPRKIKRKVESKEILNLPDFDSKGTFAILQVNEVQPEVTTVSRPDIPIPLNETQHFVQKEPQDKKVEEDKPPKTPREIFFQDLIEAAEKSESFFDFDPTKIMKKYNTENEDRKIEEETKEEKDNKEEEEKVTKEEKEGSKADGKGVVKEAEENEGDKEGAKEVVEEEKEGNKGGGGKEVVEEENGFFVGSHSEKENLTTEIFISLNEKGIVVDEPVVFGQFKVLKE